MNSFIKKFSVIVMLLISLCLNGEDTSEILFTNKPTDVNNLEETIEYIVQIRPGSAELRADRSRAMDNLPIESIPVIVRILNKSSSVTNLSYYRLLAQKFRQFESELKEPELSEATNALVNNRMAYWVNTNSTRLIYLLSISSYLGQIKNARIVEANQELLDEIEKIYATNKAAYEEKLTGNNPTSIPTRTPPFTPTTPPSNVSKPTPEPSLIPTPVSQNTASDTSTLPAWAWISAILFSLTLIGWLIKRFIKR